MTFQLVRASDTEIAVWQTEHGHIYIFAVLQDGSGLERRFTRAAPGAVESPELYAAEALAFATREAEARQLLGSRSAGCGARARRSGTAQHGMTTASN